MVSSSRVRRPPLPRRARTDRRDLDGGTIGSAPPPGAPCRTPTASIIEQGCPLFVPRVEEGWLGHDATRSIAAEYLAPPVCRGGCAGAGCTHYPLLKATIAGFMAADDPDRQRPETARATQRVLEAHALAARRPTSRRTGMSSPTTSSGSGGRTVFLGECWPTWNRWTWKADELPHRSKEVTTAPLASAAIFAAIEPCPGLRYHRPGSTSVATSRWVCPSRLPDRRIVRHGGTSQLAWRAAAASSTSGCASP